MTDKIVTEAMIEAGKRAFGDTELVGDDYIGRALTAAYTAMSTAQEPALDDDAVLAGIPTIGRGMMSNSVRAMRDLWSRRSGLLRTMPIFVVMALREPVAIAR
jgi:hypothetical protein